MQRTNLYCSERYRVDYTEQGSSRVVITFPNYGLNSLNGEGFGEGFCLKSGVDVISVKSAKNTWFNDFPADEVARIMSRVTGKYDRRIGYGSSMGGYAAIYFARLFGFDKVVAMSPQYSIKPELVPWETRWLQDSSKIVFTHSEMGQSATADVEMVFVYDPFDLDLSHVKMLKDVYPAAREIKVSHSGHPVTKTLQECNLLKMVADAEVVENAGGYDHALFQKLYREKRKDSQTYLWNLALGSEQRGENKSACEGLFRRSLAIEPTIARMRHFAWYLDNVGRHAEAASWCSRVLDTMLTPDAGFLSFYAWVLQKAGVNEEGLRVIRMALALEPDNAKFRWLEGKLAA